MITIWCIQDSKLCSTYQMLVVTLLVFACWETWLQEAGICTSIAEVDFLEVHAFGAQPKAPNPLADPLGYAQEQDRLRQAYARAYAAFFRERCPDNGVPARFTVHLIDFPDTAASYEFYATALYQRALQLDGNVADGAD